MTEPELLHLDGAVRDPAAELRSDVVAGFLTSPKTIPSKWFYDATGSDLFEQITRLPEYYPTEAERAILLTNAAEIVKRADADTLVELGAGVSDKTTALLDAIVANTGAPPHYVSFDISEDAIRAGSARLLERYPDMEILGVVGDFDRHLDQLPSKGRRLVAFLGSTIGNYRAEGRRRVLHSIATSMDDDDHLLLGTDLVKDEQRLVDAYDDAAGVTAAFNRNVMDVVAETLDLTTTGADFEHRAIWNAEDEWIEMHLVARTDLVIEIDDLRFEIGEGEHVRTEISAKFTLGRVRDDLAAAGLVLVDTWTDGDYLVSLARLASGSGESLA